MPHREADQDLVPEPAHEVEEGPQTAQRKGAPDRRHGRDRLAPGFDAGDDVIRQPRSFPRHSAGSEHEVNRHSSPLPQSRSLIRSLYDHLVPSLPAPIQAIDSRPSPIRTSFP